jgi:hypothetical protein
MLPGMIDDLLRAKLAPISAQPPTTDLVTPPQQVSSVVSLADHDRERRHAAARRLAERHNAALRP